VLSKMDINNLAVPIEDVYYDDGFINEIESLMSYIRHTNDIRAIPVTLHLNAKYVGDFYGLLDELIIPKRYHLVVTRVNGLASSGDFTGNMDYVLIPNMATIDRIKNIYQSKNF
jgi:hypothetical protein